MSKLVAGIVTATGLATVSTGGYVLFKGGVGDKSESGDAAETVTENSQTYLKFSGLSDFNNQTAGDCAKKYFGDLDFGSQIVLPVVPSDEQVAKDGKYEPPEPKPLSAQSCFVVNWDRGGEASQNWTGNFKWLWAFEEGGRGMVMFAVAKPIANESHKLSLEGRIYRIGKKDGSWVIHSKEDSASGKTVDASNFDNVFVKAAQDLGGFSSSKSDPYYWGFAEGASEMSKLCKNGDEGCPTVLNKRFRGSWSWTPIESGANTLDSWSPSINEYLKHMYPVNTDIDPNSGTRGKELDAKKSFISYKGTWNRDNEYQVNPQ